MKLWLAVLLGGALGGVLRYWFSELEELVVFASFPLATGVVNVLGSFVIGWLAGRWSGSGGVSVNAAKWHFWVTGFCGGFTTFSAFSWQVLEMVQSGRGQAAGLYAAGSVGFGLLATWLGLSLGLNRRGVAQPVETAD